MGADYIPEDNILSRYSKERTYNLIKQCKDCHFNAIRVWGGGLVTVLQRGERNLTLRKYMDPDVLVLEELECLMGKDTTQQELCVLLKRRSEEGKYTFLLEAIKPNIEAP